MRRFVDSRREKVRVQLTFDTWRNDLIGLKKHTADEAVVEMGLGDFVQKLSVGTLWYALPEQVEIIILEDGKEIHRYSDTNPPPQEVKLEKWTLQRIDQHLSIKALQKGIQYQRVFQPRKKQR